MSDLLDWVRQRTGARAASIEANLQTLWGGYGELLRVHLEGCKYPRVVVKKIAPPANLPGDRSHCRKLRSYQVEASFYRHHAARCGARCRVPLLLGSRHLGEETDLILEDLDGAGFPLRRRRLSRDQVASCLSWLAHFHATFLGSSGAGLWPVGNYWHLATRPDELRAMAPGPLEQTAAALDGRLRGARYKTLVHGDAKLANFCFPSGPGPVAAVDFQYVGRGPGVCDLAYFLGSVLPESAPECLWQEYLEEYFALLRAAIRGLPEGHFQATDSQALEAEWRELYPIAVADFARFLGGWGPQYLDLSGHSGRCLDQALEQLADSPLLPRRILRDPGGVSPEWLSEVLRTRGLLQQGEVREIHVETGEGRWSRNARLLLGYSPGARGERPASLFLKTCHHPEFVRTPAGGGEAPSEVAAYTEDYRHLSKPPLPRCLHAGTNPETGAYHLLLEDLSASHRDAFDLTPDASLGQGLARSLAHLHAAHWGPRALAARGLSPEAPPSWEAFRDHCLPGLEPLLALLGDGLSPRDREDLERVMARGVPACRRRAGVSPGTTLLHGDLNPGNLLVPREGPGPVLLIDRQPFSWSLRAGPGALDLAIAMVLHWPREVRAELEELVLKEYLSGLAAQGASLTPEDLWLDYRHSLFLVTHLAVEWCVEPEDRSRMRWLWEDQIRRCLAALRDHRALGLLG